VRGALASLAVALSLAASGLSAQAAAPIVFQDGAGRTVRLEKPAERIAVVRSACMMPEALAAFGAQGRLVQGLCMRFGEKDLLLRIAPNYVPLQPLFPSNGLVNVEELLKSRPDLAFISSDLKNAAAIEAAGVPTVVVEPSMKDFREIYRIAGSVLGMEGRAKRLTDYADRIFALVASRLAAVPEKDRPRALYVQASKPPQVMGMESYNAWTAEMAGAVYCAREVSGSFLSVSMEQIVAWNPDFILVSPKDTATLADIKGKPEWAGISAVAKGRALACPLGAFYIDKPCAEAPLYVLWQAGIYYPALFPKDELVKETAYFFKEFFRYELSAQELGEIAKSYGP
jgi:iron complex transport system substrate-binding protein